MTTAAELKAQSAALQAQAEALEAAETLAKIDEIKQIIKDAGLTLAHFGLIEYADKKTRKARKPAQIKYRTPEGQEWNGMGRKPAWAKDLTTEQLAAFFVQHVVAAQTVEAIEEQAV